MSSFLSNFQPDDYQGKEVKREKTTVTDATALAETRLETQEPTSTEEGRGGLSEREGANRRARHGVEETEIDPTFKKRQRRKYRLMFALGIALVLMMLVVGYQLTHVQMPNFANKPIAEVKTWAAKNKITVKTKLSYNQEIEVNSVIKQPIKKGKSVKKGQALTFDISQGADPEVVVPLPDFAKLSEAEATEFLQKNQLEKLKLITEYHNEKPKGAFLALELAEAATKEGFKRKNGGRLVYSKGKEVFQKNIVIPDFIGKQKSEVEAWAKANSIDVTYQETPMKELELGKISSQSIAAKEKIAKESKMTVAVSAGKPITVPNFANLTPELAAAQQELKITVVHEFNSDVTYGQLIAQSVESGTELSEKDELEITVTYSAGRPYLKDYTGETEGELQKLFFDDYQSKGGNINYTVAYVDSAEKKGTVVGMSSFNTYVPIDYTVAIQISNGAGA